MKPPSRPGCGRPEDDSDVADSFETKTDPATARAVAKAEVDARTAPPALTKSGPQMPGRRGRSSRASDRVCGAVPTGRPVTIERNRAA
ncbi:hypothetical protein ACAG26_20250 [Mycobacterium sp. pUA109]|uniref:hypothetical protein n=1 Tax=Mycobacterium sp. pUA109 TaxID=3238982 RepID=UPI00351BC550